MLPEQRAARKTERMDPVNKGIDVSKWQGKIDWNKVKSSGIQFVIIRAGLGRLASQKDICFDQNITGALGVGLPVGVYWYSYATSPAEAVQEAEACLSVLKPWQNRLQLPVFFDQEYEPGIKALDDKTRTDICLAFMQRIQEAGYRTGLYCSYDWYQNWVQKDRLAAYPVWIAQYASKCSYTGKNLIAWQYSSGGKVAGINGNVDMNEGYDGLLETGKEGWAFEDGAWYWYLSGVRQVSRWVQTDGLWYYVGADGKMVTGWLTLSGKTYWLNTEKTDKLPLGACLITDESGALT